MRNEKEQTQGITAEVVCREYGVSRGALYNWRCKYERMSKPDDNAVEDAINGAF